MGAGQSSANGGADSSQNVKTSYYELLGVDRQATSDEIKKAYRRKALELHPDRNYGNEDVATKTFAEIQAAHEILSDPQERAWYDSHESAILRGDEVGEGGDEVPSYGNIKITTADDLARLVRKFNSGVAFTDAPSGFFGFLRETFEQLAKEEEAAASWDNVEAPEYPTFGHKDDEYNDVVKQFYSSWSSFATAKNFSWKDKYRLSEAPDRWYRRRMEQENSKIRQDAKREFNDAVRSLVAFIRKRDPRYIPNTQSEEERQHILRNAAAAQAARARAANAAKMEGDVPEWTKIREPEELEESEEEEEEQEVFECVACNKIFKSENQWEAHEKSKKHQKAVRALQHKMRKENNNLDLDGEGLEPDTEFTKIEEDHDIEQIENLDEVESTTQSNDNDPDDQLNSSAPQERHHIRQADAGQSESDVEAASSVPGMDNTLDQGDYGVGSENEDYASIETIQARMRSAAIDEESDSDKAARGKPKLGKAKQKRAKKAAAAAANQQSASKNSCEACGESFPSRTTLFKHIKEEGHAALKSVAGRGGKRSARSAAA